MTAITTTGLKSITPDGKGESKKDIKFYLNSTTITKIAEIIGNTSSEEMQACSIDFFDRVVQPFMVVENQLDNALELFLDCLTLTKNPETLKGVKEALAVDKLLAPSLDEQIERIAKIYQETQYDEEKINIRDTIIAQVLPLFTSPDNKTYILAVFEIFVTVINKAKDEEIEFIKKELASNPILFSKKITEIKDEPKEVQEIVQLPYSEKTFKDLSQSVENLLEKTAELSGKVSDQIKVVSGNRTAYRTNAASNKKTKSEEEGKKYPAFYNEFATLMASIREQEKSIEDLKNQIKSFSDTTHLEVTKSDQLLENLLSKIQHEHNLLETVIQGKKVSLSNSFTGSITRTRYISQPSINFKGYHQSNFTVLKDELNKYFQLERDFIERAEQYMAGISTPRKTLNILDRDYLIKVEKAKKLQPSYAAFHDKFIDQFDQLKNFKVEVDYLTNELTNLLNDDSKKILEKKQNLYENMKSLLENTKKLDATISNGGYFNPYTFSNGYKEPQLDSVELMEII